MLVASDSHLFNLSRFTINLSKRVFSSAEISLLDKGLTFIPTVDCVPLHDILECFSRNIRNLKLRDFFYGSDKPYDPSDFSNCFIPPSLWIPPTNRLSSSVLNVISVLEKDLRDLIVPRIVYQRNCKFVVTDKFLTYNLSSQELAALQALRSDPNIIIKPADKGGSVVIMDRDLYAAEARRQLYNTKYYRRIERPLASTNVLLINEILTDMFNQGFINCKQFLYLSPDLPSHTRAFYLLPKVHKPRNKWPSFFMPEGRPIVSDCSSETYRICELIDYFLKPLANKHSSYVQDTYDFIAKIRDTSIPPNALLVTGDITALYTNMNISRSLQVVENIFAANPDPHRPDKHILQLLDICLRFNDFEFAGEIFLQILGIAMGKAFAPNLANIYLLEFDRAATSAFSVTPSLYHRFIDDVFFVWPASDEQLDLYRVFLNGLIPDIKVTLVSKRFITEFLDTLIYKHFVGNVAVLKTRVFFKSTDTHQLLHGRSLHPKHTCRGVLKSQLIRFKRICSNKSEFEHAAYTLFGVLKNRGYSRSLFRRLKREVWLSNCLYSRDRKDIKRAQDIWPIINFFDPIGFRIMHFMRKRIASLNISNSFKVVSAFKIHRNLARLLIRSRF